MARKRERARPRRVVYIIFGLACGGAEMVLLELVKGLDRSRYEPIVISLAPPDTLSDDFARAGVQVQHLGLRRLVDSPATFLRAAVLVKRLQPDLLHGVLFYGDITARLLRMLRVAPKAVSAIHSTYIGPRWQEQVLRHTDPFASAVTAVSTIVADARVAARTTSREKIKVIENGIDPARFGHPDAAEIVRIRDRLGIDSQDRVVLCVGRLEPEKNHALLIRAFARIVQTHADALLLIVGSGSLASELENDARGLGIGARVRFAGHLSPVDPVFHLAELFVLSSSIEGLPMVVLEAMAASLPMVLTNVGGIPDVVDNELTGLLVPPEDEDALAFAIARMLDATVETRAAFGAAARRRLEERFSMEAMVTSTQTLYDSLFSGGPGA